MFEGSNDGGILLSGSTFAEAIYIDEPYKYDQKKRVATLGEVSSTIDNKLSSYVTKTDIVPSQTNIGAAENAVRSVYASYDGDGNLIDYFYAKKSELEQLSAVVGTANTQLEEIA